jgi:hypothetical protein
MRFIRPFKILEKRGEVAYRLELPPQLFGVHVPIPCLSTEEVSSCA